MTKTTFPPLLQFAYILQQSAEEMLAAEAGVGLSAARIMGVLNNSSPASQRLIAMKLRQTEANISRQLQAMKTQGLVNIAPNKKDARQRDVSLSAKGANKCQQATNVLKKHQRQFIRLLNSSESEALALMAKKLA